MNKLAWHISFVFIVLLPVAALGQRAVQLTNWGQGAVGPITSHEGNLFPNFHTVRFQYTGHALHMPQWRLSVQLKSPIVAPDGTVFPADKLSFRIANTSGQPAPAPSVAQIGAPLSVPLAETGEIFLVPNANYPLMLQPVAGNAYYDLQLHYHLEPAGGGYLPLLNRTAASKDFHVALEFKLYDADNSLLDVGEAMFAIQLGPFGDLNPLLQYANQLSLSVGGPAMNGQLDYTTHDDYTGGVRVAYHEGLRVAANVDYQILVRATQSAFTSTSDSGDTLPLDIIEVSLEPESGQAAFAFPVPLSAVSQRVVQGESTAGLPVFYTIKYATKPNDMRLVHAKAAAYQARLQYEIMPR